MNGNATSITAADFNAWLGVEHCTASLLLLRVQAAAAQLQALDTA